jgi:uncharacterized membrane protein YdjX (TVP38/TMEM64 family)
MVPFADRARSAVTAVDRRRGVWIATVAVSAVVLIAVLALDPEHLISLSQLQARRHQLQHAVHAHPAQSLLIYMGLYVLVTGFSLPGALVMTLAGGFLFGLWEGAAAAVTGASAGCTAMFLAARSAWGETLRARASRAGGLMQRLEAGASRDAFTYILMLRLIPGVPIWLVNVTAGLLRMRLLAYLTATIVGIAPSTIVYAAIGSDFGRMFERGQRPNPALLLQPQWLATLAGLAALALIPAAWRYRRLWRRP